MVFLHPVAREIGLRDHEASVLNQGRVAQRHVIFAENVVRVPRERVTDAIELAQPPRGARGHAAKVRVDVANAVASQDRTEPCGFEKPLRIVLSTVSFEGASHATRKRTRSGAAIDFRPELLLRRQVGNGERQRFCDFGRIVGLANGKDQWIHSLPDHLAHFAMAEGLHEGGKTLEEVGKGVRTHSSDAGVCGLIGRRLHLRRDYRAAFSAAAGVRLRASS